MSSYNIISTELAPAAVGAYSQGAEVDGTYYFSGQLGLDPISMNLHESFEAQLDQVMKNIDALLDSQNLTRKNIFKTTIFITDLKNFKFVNAAYESFFEKPYPARSCVEVSKLPKDGLVEIEVIAKR